MEDRLKSLENDRDEWKSCCKVRVQGCEGLTKRLHHLHSTSKEFWRIKTELVDLLHPALNPIVESFPVENRTRIRTEIQDVFGNSDALLGVFPVGAPWTQEKALDIRFKPSLLSLRANHLVKFVLGPKLREKESDFKLWVPLSAPEMERKQKRRERNGDGRSRSARGRR